MARAGLRISVRELAEMSGVTPNTVSRYENGKDAMASTLERIRAALETAGVEFIPGGVRLRP